ncbi:hypothetical protein [Streptomyces sp. NPDC001415]
MKFKIHVSNAQAQNARSGPDAGLRAGRPHLMGNSALGRAKVEFADLVSAYL